MKFFYIMLFMVFTMSLSAQQSSAPLQLGTAEISGFKLYPNPAFDNVIYITTAKNAEKNVLIYDVFGKIVLQNRIKNTRLDISDLHPGVYVMKVEEQNSSITRKLVIK